MRRIALFAAGTLFGVTAFSQSLLDCMDQDVVRGLLLQGQSENPIVISAAVPPETGELQGAGAVHLDRQRRTWPQLRQRQHRCGHHHVEDQCCLSLHRCLMQPDAPRRSVR